MSFNDVYNNYDNGCQTVEFKELSERTPLRKESDGSSGPQEGDDVPEQMSRLRESMEEINNLKTKLGTDADSRDLREQLRVEQLLARSLATRLGTFVSKNKSKWPFSTKLKEETALLAAMTSTFQDCALHESETPEQLGTLQYTADDSARETEQEIKAMEAELVMLSDVFKDMAELTQMQQDSIAEINGHTARAAHDTAAANTQLLAASRYAGVGYTVGIAASGAVLGPAAAVALGVKGLMACGAFALGGAGVGVVTGRSLGKMHSSKNELQAKSLAASAAAAAAANKAAGPTSSPET